VMRARTLLFLVLALGAASLAAMFARGMISSQRAAIANKPAAPAIAATEVLVAGHPIPAGQFLKAEDLSWQVWPEGNLAAGYVTKAKGSTEPFVGAVVKVGFSAGEPVTEARVAKPGDRGFLAAVLSPGTRAVAVSVNPTTGVSGFVLPGDRIDVLVTHVLPPQGAEKRTVNATETAIEDLRVIAIDQSTSDQSDKAVLAKTVTLEATPKQAEMLSLIAQMGKISLSLRSLAVAQTADPKRVSPPSAGKPTPHRTYTVDTEASALLSRQAPFPTVQVVRGGKSKMEGGAAAPAGAVTPEDGETTVPASDPAIETSAAEAAAAVARLP
jgi:pilus assembly protein CpaB